MSWRRVVIEQMPEELAVLDETAVEYSQQPQWALAEGRDEPSGTRVNAPELT